MKNFLVVILLSLTILFSGCSEKSKQVAPILFNAISVTENIDIKNKEFNHG